MGDFKTFTIEIDNKICQESSVKRIKFERANDDNQGLNIYYDIGNGEYILLGFF